LPEDVDAALEWQAYQALSCSGCGQPKHESFSPAGPDYEVTALRCRACEARDTRRAAWAEQDNANLHGLYFGVSPT